MILRIRCWFMLCPQFYSLCSEAAGDKPICFLFPVAELVLLHSSWRNPVRQTFMDLPSCARQREKSRGHRDEHALVPVPRNSLMFPSSFHRGRQLLFGEGLDHLPLNFGKIYSLSESYCLKCKSFCLLNGQEVRRWHKHLELDSGAE